MNLIYITYISKAFDTINHLVLIIKLELMGVHILKWLKSYISFRTLKIRLNGYVSENMSVPLCVPQSGHIFPLFFCFKIVLYY